MNDWLDIHALADGCLEGEARAEAEAQIAASPSCKAELQTIMLLKATVQEKAPVHQSPATWDGCRQRLAELQKKRRVEYFVGRYAWGLTSIFFAAILGAAIMNRTAPVPDLATGDVAKIVSGMAQLNTNRSQPEDMRSWIRNKPVTLELGGMQPVYMRSGLYKGRDVSLISVADDKGAFYLMVLRGEEQIDGVEPMSNPGDYMAVRMEGANGVTWTDQGYTLMVVGPRSQDEMLRIAESVRIRR